MIDLEHPWRAAPALAGRFTVPGYPDDLQVLVHDGGPKFTESPLELIWARVVSQEGCDFFAIAANQPTGVHAVRHGEMFAFRASAGLPHPLMVSADYRRERSRASIEPCERCGADELLDPPSRLVAHAFGDGDIPPTAVLNERCWWCREGMMLVTVTAEARS